MQKYRWPGFEMQLLGELQRQQNNAQFCDTLLQTEGISVPTHSCILAALSPYLSQKLAASPCPPLGHKHQLQLQAVKAKTLLKLVGLLYSGELEVKGSLEENDVLSAARQFGITDLVEGQKGGGMKEGAPQKKIFGSCREKEEEGGERKNGRNKMQDAQVQADMAQMRATDSPIEKRNCVSKGTQTVQAGEKTAATSFTPSSHTKPPSRDPASSIAQSLDFSITVQPQNITLNKHFHSTSFPHIPSMISGAPNNKESALDQCSDSLTNPTSTSARSSDVTSVPVSLNDDSISLTAQEDSSHQQSSEFGDSNQLLAKEEIGLEDGKTKGKTAAKTQNTEQPSHTNRDETQGEEKGNSPEKRPAKANVGMKSLAKMKKMQQMMETTQISIKLRRRTKGQVWEVVSMQDTDEPVSVLTSLKQDDSDFKRSQADLPNGELPPTSVQPAAIHKREALILQPAATKSPVPPPHPNTASNSQLPCSDCFTSPKHSNEVSPPQPPGPVEESDEQIEKLLEDIMMDLDILPNLERDCKKSHPLQPSHDGAPAVCLVPVTEDDRAQSQMCAAASAAVCVYHQESGRRFGHSSTDTAQNQPSCSSLSSIQLDSVLLHQQQQQRSPQYHSSVASMDQRDGRRHQVMPLTKSQNCSYPDAATTRSVTPMAFCSSWQKLHYPACQEPSSQDNKSILELLPLMNGNEAQSLHSFSLPDDFRLPRCLSPLEPFASVAKHQPVFNNSANHGDTIQPQPSLRRRPWLTENPGSLQFPLSAIIHRENKSVPLPQDLNRSSWSKWQQKHLQLNPQNRGTWPGSCTMKEVEEKGTICAGFQSVSKVTSDRRKRKESLKCKQCESTGNAAEPKGRKRKRTSPPQDAAGSLLAYKNVEVSDGTKSQISLSVCSVSLSSNNVLLNEKEEATSPSNVPNTFVWKPNKPSTTTEGLREKTRGAGDLKTDQTRIRTRGFLKRTQETPSNTSLENSSVLKCLSRRAKIVNKHRVLPPRQTRGRLLTTKLEESSPAISEKKSHSVESEQQIDSSLPKEVEDGDKTKRMCRKRRRNRSEVIPLKTIGAESTGKAEAADDDVIPAERKVGTPQQSRMVAVKEFQKLIKRQHSKTRKSEESQRKETNECEVKACGSRGEELTKKTEIDVDIIQPHKRDGPEEPHIVFSVTVDKNHNQIFNKSTAEYSKDDTDSSVHGETGLLGDEYQPAFSCHVLGEEVAELAAEREQSLKNPEEAQKASDAGVSDTSPKTAINDDGSSNGDTHLPQEDKKPLDLNLNPQTPERNGPPLLDTLSKSASCHQEEEEEEVEVDILLYSPDKVPQSRECEKALDSVDVTPEEEEEEDVYEIDVTGDEAE